MLSFLLPVRKNPLKLRRKPEPSRKQSQSLKRNLEGEVELEYKIMSILKTNDNQFK